MALRADSNPRARDRARRLCARLRASARGPRPVRRNGAAVSTRPIDGSANLRPGGISRKYAASAAVPRRASTRPAEQMPRFLVDAVEVEKCAVLLDDEHFAAHAKQRVQVARREIGESTPLPGDLGRIGAAAGRGSDALSYTMRGTSPQRIAASHGQAPSHRRHSRRRHRQGSRARRRARARGGGGEVRHRVPVATSSPGAATTTPSTAA